MFQTASAGAVSTANCCSVRQSEVTPRKQTRSLDARVLRAVRRMRRVTLRLANPSSPAEYGTFLRKEVDALGKVIRDAKVSVDE